MLMSVNFKVLMEISFRGIHVIDKRKKDVTKNTKIFNHLLLTDISLPGF